MSFARIAALSVFAALCGSNAALAAVEQVSRTRELSLQQIVGYQPRTQVTDHAALDQDQVRLLCSQTMNGTAHNDESLYRRHI